MNKVHFYVQKTGNKKLLLLFRQEFVYVLREMFR